MNRLFVEYPKCSTCRKAKKYLEEHQVAFEDRHIVCLLYTSPSPRDTL